MTDIAVIGGGAAGIAAARRLHELKQDYVLLEAKDEIGGRCVTDWRTLGTPVDLGAHWLHSPALNPMKAFADSRGIRYGAKALDGGYSRNGAWLDAADAAACTAYVEGCFERIRIAGHNGRDGAVTELFSGYDEHPWHDVFLAELQAKLGVAPDQCSILDFARYVWEGDDLPVTDGYGTLLAALAHGVTIKCAAPVERVGWSNGQRIDIATPHGTLSVKHAIFTVSTAILATGIVFAPSLPDWKRSAIADLPMGSCNKAALRFTDRVFADCPPRLILPLRGTESVELVVGQGDADIATCLFNGPLSKDLAQAGAGAMVEYALETLVEIFGSALKQALLPQRLTVDWDSDRYIGGSFSAARPGRADARADLARAIEDRLFFAGEATSLDFMGDVHGAWFSGIQAAEDAVSAFRGLRRNLDRSAKNGHLA